MSVSRYDKGRYLKLGIPLYFEVQLVECMVGPGGLMIPPNECVPQVIILFFFYFDVWRLAVLVLFGLGLCVGPVDSRTISAQH